MTTTTIDQAALEADILSAVKTVYDPEIPVDIHELGLIYELRVDADAHAYVKMTLTTPACPVAGSLPGEVEQKVLSVPGIESVKVELTFDPPWEMHMMSEAAKLTLGMF